MTSSGTTSEPDVVDVLSTDHREFLGLVAEIRAESDPAARRELTDTLIAELVRHSVAEEMFVYPAIKDAVPNGKDATDHDAAEHKQLEALMKKLESADPASPEFLEHLSGLEAVLRDHVQDEEGEQFPQLRRAVSREQLVALAGKVETAKKISPTRPHPLSPNNQLFHKTVGAGVGLVDRLRDTLTGRATG